MVIITLPLQIQANVQSCQGKRFFYLLAGLNDTVISLLGPLLLAEVFMSRGMILRAYVGCAGSLLQMCQIILLEIRSIY